MYIAYGLGKNGFPVNPISVHINEYISAPNIAHNVIINIISPVSIIKLLNKASGAPGGTRTRDPSIKSRLLVPSELQAHKCLITQAKILFVKLYYFFVLRSLLYTLPNAL